MYMKGNMSITHYHFAFLFVGMMKRNILRLFLLKNKNFLVKCIDFLIKFALNTFEL